MNARLKPLILRYRRTSLREKLLLLVFIVVILTLWASHWSGRAGTWNDQRQSASVDLTTQRQWLERREEFSIGLERALERVDPSKTYEAARLSGRIDSLLREHGLSAQADIDPVRTREGEIFNDHNLRVRLSRISIAQFVVFNEALSLDSPYINIESVRIAANRNNPEQLDVRFEINSFDLKADAL